MRGLIRAIKTVVLAAGLWAATAPIDKGDVETLMVPSAAMGRDIPVAFQGGGPHMVVLLDAFNAGPDVSNWVTAGNAMNTLAGKGISVAAPAGGPGSRYTHWGRGGRRAGGAFHPDRYRFGGSLSGFLTPSNTYLNGAITAGLAEFGGVDTRNMWGLPQLGRWKWHDPDVHVQLLADNNTRLWVYSPSTLTCSDPAAMTGD